MGRKNVEKIPQCFLEEKKTHFFGVGAPTPIFEPYISSYNHIFGQNVTKLHFLYPTKHSGYYYVCFLLVPPPLFGTEALLPYQWPMMAITNNFPTNWVEFGHIFL